MPGCVVGDCNLSVIRCCLQQSVAVDFPSNMTEEVFKGIYFIFQRKYLYLDGTSRENHRQIEEQWELASRKQNHIVDWRIVSAHGYTVRNFWVQLWLYVRYICFTVISSSLYDRFRL